MTRRGIVLPLTQEQRVTRARYLAGQVPLSALDAHVRRDARTLARMTGYRHVEMGLDAVWCPDLYYQLEYPNGGTDPTAPDPAARVEHPHVTARLCDCSGAGWWCQGIDRFLLDVEIEGYVDMVGRLRGSWLNTDSAIIAARTGVPGLVLLERPEPGCVITCESGARGHTVGHQATVVSNQDSWSRWDPEDPGCWDMLEVVDVARRMAGGQPARANRSTSARGWCAPWQEGKAAFIRVELAPNAGAEP